jgi:hypothetical protein
MTSHEHHNLLRRFDILFWGGVISQIVDQSLQVGVPAVETLILAFLVNVS